MPDEKTKGPVPRLRFPEFHDAGEWVVKRLGDLGKILKGKGISKSDITEGGALACIHYGELYTHYPEVIREIVSSTDVNPDNLVLSEKNDVIIPASGETREDIATASCLTEKGVALGGDLNIFRSALNGAFLAYYIRGNLKAEISRVAQGDAVVHLYPSQLEKVKLAIPPKRNEQQKIADFLSSLDDLIRAEEAALEALKKHKKGLMQRLFPRKGETTPRLRFPEFRDAGEWEVKRLGDKSIAKFIRDRVPSEEIPVGHYVSTVNLLPDFGGLATEPETPPPNNAIAYREGDILISNIRPYLKKVWVADRSGGASYDVLVARAGKGIKGSYLGHLLMSDRFITHVMEGAKGVKMPRGDLEQIKYFQVPVPPNLNEQQKIADCLESLDDLIRARSKRIEALKQHKKGLMQQLFPQEVG